MKQTFKGLMDDALSLEDLFIYNGICPECEKLCGSSQEAKNHCKVSK